MVKTDEGYRSIIYNHSERYELNKWYTAIPMIVHAETSDEEYEAGFHVFQSPEAAKKFTTQGVILTCQVCDLICQGPQILTAGLYGHVYVARQRILIREVTC